MAALDTSMFTSSLGGWFGSTILWLVVLFVLAIVGGGFLIIRKRKKLRYQCVEIVRYGHEEGKKDPSNRLNAKWGFNIIPCGWFGSKRHLFGLWDTGPEIMKLKTGEVIVGFSTDDYQEVNGKRGVVAFRDPLNQDILAPINKVSVENSELLNVIAPQDFRDEAAKLMNDADVETQDKTLKVAAFVVLGLLVIAVLVLLIILINYQQHVTDSANTALTTASSTCLSNIKTVCGDFAAQFAKSGAAGVIPTPSTAP